MRRIDRVRVQRSAVPPFLATRRARRAKLVLAPGVSPGLATKGSRAAQRRHPVSVHRSFDYRVAAPRLTISPFLHRGLTPAANTNSAASRLDLTWIIHLFR